MPLNVNLSGSRILRSHDAGSSIDPLREAVRSYKDAMRSAKQDLNVSFLLKTLSAVNESSPLKVARNPIDQDRRWRSGVELRNVRGFEIDEEGQLTIRTRSDNGELSAELALDQLYKMRRKLQSDGSVMLVTAGDKKVKITDAYSHAFVNDAYAGLPFDLVLAYFEEDPA